MSDYTIYKREEHEYHPVHRPEHYNKGKVETIKMLRDTLSKEAYEGFIVGNCHKYLQRYKFKNKVEDLRKAQTYLNMLIREYDEGYLE